MNKIKRFLAVFVSACTVAAAIPSAFALADGERVVTLGADLDDDQRQMILKYFGIEGETLETLTITNDDEREHLGAYVPLEQIGTRTYSCAYVNPTNSGGIQVKTANLTWVTSNMIASTLSTSGVVNCDVLAAAPFAVSGTGALTGVIMAYESASGETLDSQKKDVANQELVTTATIGDSVGQDMATLIVNEAKEEVIEGDVIDTGDITNIVNNITVENNITLSQDDTDLLVSLLEEISQLDYDIDDMKETLDRVQDNVSAELDGTTDSSDSDSVDDDSILKNTDDSALGDDANINSTDPSAVETEASQPLSSDQTEEIDDDSGLQIVVSDTYNSNDDGSQEEEEPADEEEPETNPALVVEDLGPEMDSDDSDLEDTSSDEEEDVDLEEAGLVDDGWDVFDTSDDTIEADEDQEAAEEPLEETAEDSDEQAEDQDSSAFEANLTMNPESTVSPGLNVLSVSADQDGVTAGSGTLTVYTSDGSAVDSIAMDDSSSVASNGYEFDIYLDSPLAAGTSYYAVLSDDALEQNGAPMSATDGSEWTFDTFSEGVGMMESVNGISAGSTANGSVYIDPSSAGYAVIDSVTVDGSDVTDSAALSQSDFNDNGSFQVTFPQSGQAVIHVTYYDSADAMNYVNEASCTVSVW